MKLKELAIDGLGTRRDLHLSRFGDGLSIVYGENGAGKTTVRQFIRATLFDLERNGLQRASTTYSAGRLNVIYGLDEFQLSRDVQLNSEVDVRRLTNATSGYAGDDLDPIMQLAQAISPELYDSVFSVSFRDTPTNVARLASVLHHQLGVPNGPQAAGDESAFLSWQRETKIRQQQVESLKTRIDLLTVERNGCVNQIEAGRSGHQGKLNDVERQISQVMARLNELQDTPYREQLKSVEREIAQLRLLMDNASAQVTYVAPETSQYRQNSSLYLRLDEIDNQIRRWRHLQTDIQNQRVRLRDEMLIWNELTLDSDEHPYHQARAILVALESKVDEAERHANHWGDAAAARVDTTQMARTLGQLCETMREDLYGLCDELSQQYKHIRHKAAAAELKQLRRCYGEMGENIQRLMHRRDSVIQEIREIDPAGANAILRSDPKFCEFAQQAGYLEARQKFVGPLSAPTPKPTYHVNAPSLQSERGRLTLLEQQLLELHAIIAGQEKDRQELHSRHAELVRQRDGLHSELSYGDLNSNLSELESQLQTLNDQYSKLLQQLDLDRDFRPAPPNPLLQSACSMLTRISNGDLTQVFLSVPLGSVDGLNANGLQVRDRFGKVLNFSAIDAGLQDQVYLCVMLAAKQQLKVRGIQVATLIDDAFYRIPSERITATLNELRDFAAQGHQVVALTQHRYLADRVPGVPLLELPPPMPSVQPLTQPDRRSTADPVIAPIPEPVWNPDSFVTTDVYASSAMPRPYPLSKYPRSNSLNPTSEHEVAVSYPFSVSVQPAHTDYFVPTQTTAAGFATQSVTSVPVSSVGDRLGYVASIDDSTRLDTVGFFDPHQLRTFYANGISTVADMLELEVGQGHVMGLHPDQIDRWQSQLWLLINLPGLRLNDARVLVACGVTDPEHLDTSHPQQIFERIERFYATSEGRRFAGEHDPISLERVNGWYRSLDATRPRWSDPRGQKSPVIRMNGEHRDNAYRQPESEPAPARRTPYEHTARAYQPYSREELGRTTRSDRNSKPARAARPATEPRLARPPRMSTPQPERRVVPRVAPATKMAADRETDARPAKTPPAPAKQDQKFYLDLNDHVEAAPSIGPKTAERFEKIGVSTVTDFLKQTAESMQTKIKYKRITAALIREWQHQARLVCRIPNLRGHDAQLLVACGITEPEELATMQPKSLFEIIGPFSDTKEGMKIIRNGKKPDLAEVTDWINWAAQTRSLQAA